MIFSKRRGGLHGAAPLKMPVSAFSRLLSFWRKPLRLTSAAAFFLFDSDVFPLAGGGSFTPSRRAWIGQSQSPDLSNARRACRGERAQSPPGRTPLLAWRSLSFRLALRALLRVCFSGIDAPPMYLNSLELYFHAAAVRRAGTKRAKAWRQ